MIRNWYDMNGQNVDSYRSLGWILNDSDDGLFFLIASERMQREIIVHYETSNVAVYDYKKNPSSYASNHLEEWINGQADADAYFIVNFQLAIQNDEDIKRLNFSRDILSRLDKNIVFFMTQNTDNKLAKGAYDLYSYIKFRIFFEDEFVDAFASQQYDIINDFHIVNTDLSATKNESIYVNSNQDDIDFNQPKELLLSMAISFVNKSQQYQNDFHYNDALSVLFKAMNIREKLLGAKHPDTAAVYHKISLIYYLLYKFKEALKYYSKALLIRRKVLGEEHPDTAAIYNDIAMVYYSQGEYEKSLEYHRKALQIKEKVLGKEHPDTAGTYNNIANMYYSQGEYEKSLEYHNKALPIRVKVLGKEHPDTAATYHNIALVYYSQGEYERSLEYFNKDLQISETVLGKEHPYTAKTYHNIAILYEAQGELDQALEYYKKTLKVFKLILGEQHPQTINLYNIIKNLQDNNNSEKI